MKKIEHIEKHLPQKRKTLLYCLRENYWDVVDVVNEGSSWAFEEKWLVGSTRENKGVSLALWFFRHDGESDGMNRVVATLENSPEPHCYGGDVSIEFDSRKFETQLEIFLSNLHRFRINGVFEDHSE